MTKQEILLIIAVVVLVPIGLYLTEQTYRGVYGNSTLWRDITSLINKYKQWKYRREERKKYEYLNKRKK